MPLPGVQPQAALRGGIHKGAHSRQHRADAEVQPCLPPLLHPAAPHRSADPSRELDTTAFLRILDEIAGAGCLWLLLTGGEPLLRSDFTDIYIHAKRLGMIVTLFTNGTPITPRIAGVLEEWPPFVVEVSIYGATAGTCERFTGSKGVLSRALRGIELLLESGLRVRMKSTITRRNLHEIEAMREIADGYGLDYRYDPVINAGLDGSLAPLEERLSPEEILELDMRDQTRWKGLREFWERFGDYAVDDPALLYQCGAGTDSFHVDPMGRLSVCMMSREPSYDLLEGSFDEAWRHFVPGVLGTTLTKESPCAECRLLPLCGQCPGLARIETGDPERPVEFLCRLAHLRAEALGA